MATLEAVIGRREKKPLTKKQKFIVKVGSLIGTTAFIIGEAGCGFLTNEVIGLSASEILNRESGAGQCISAIDKTTSSLEGVIAQNLSKATNTTIVSKQVVLPEEINATQIGSIGLFLIDTEVKSADRFIKLRQGFVVDQATGKCAGVVFYTKDNPPDSQGNVKKDPNFLIDVSQDIEAPIWGFDVPGLGKKVLFKQGLNGKPEAQIQVEGEETVNIPTPSSVTKNSDNDNGVMNVVFSNTSQISLENPPLSPIEPPAVVDPPVVEPPVVEAPIIVTADSEWAKLNVPVGLEIKVEGNVTYAINRLGEKVEIARDGKTAEWLVISFAPNMESSATSVIPAYEGGPQTVVMLAKLNAQPFPEGTRACERGDIKTKNVLDKYEELVWANNQKDIPAITLGFFRVNYKDKVLIGKVVEWLTDKGIIHVPLVNTEKSFTHIGTDSILPIGLGKGEVPIDAVEPKGEIVWGTSENLALADWVANGCPSSNAQDHFFILGGSK